MPETEMQKNIRTGRVWTYQLGDSELWRCDHMFTSESAAIEAGKVAAAEGDDFDEPCVEYQTGRIIVVGSEIVRASREVESLIERMAENAFDRVGEGSDDWPDPDDMAKRIAESHIAAAISAIVSGSRSLVEIIRVKTHKLDPATT